MLSELIELINTEPQFSATPYFYGMMGEYIVYYREKIAAYICDERFLVKPTAAAKALLPSAPSEPPYEGAKEMLLVEDVDDKELLQRLFKRMYDELPAPRHKGKKGERQ